MATATITTRTPTVADLLGRFDEVLARRILLDPIPGTATVDDVVAIHAREKRLCELVDGILVEKAMGYEESSLALILGHFLWTYLEGNPIGVAAGADGMMRLAPKLVRIPDVSFVSWDQFPDGIRAKGPVPAIHPDLAVEILSESNTAAEMDRKLGDYFAAGTRIVWYMDPPSRTVRVFTAADQVTVVDESGTLDGGDVLPGFRLAVRDWFARAERPGG